MASPERAVTSGLTTVVARGPAPTAGVSRHARTILPSGDHVGLWRRTTNPTESQGGSITLALRAGGAVATLRGGGRALPAPTSWCIPNVDARVTRSRLRAKERHPLD